MTRKKAEPAAATPATPYVPTEREKAFLEAFSSRREAMRPFPRLKATKKAGVANISSDHPDEQVAQMLQNHAMGLTRAGEFSALLKDVFNFTASDSEVDETAANEAMALIVGLEPTNTMEAMLAVQMAAIHRATISAALRVRKGGDLESAQFNAKTLNNLARTFAAQAETMKKLRSTGEQKVTVEHRHYHLAAGAISPGSQAVLGDVSGGGAEIKTELQSHEPANVLLSERAAMLGTIQADGLPVPGASNGWEGSVPLPRGTSRSALRAA